MRASATLETGNELEEDPINPVAKTGLIPLHLSGVLFALVEQEGFHVVGSHGVPFRGKKRL